MLVDRWATSLDIIYKPAGLSMKQPTYKWALWIMSLGLALVMWMMARACVLYEGAK
jgi:hypothetical protein